MLIGLNGFKGVGKDEVANYYVEHHGYKRLAFADKLKEAVAALFGVPLHWVDEYKDPESRAWVGLFGGEWDELGNRTKRSMDWRLFLQRFGTEMGRGVFGENFWVDQTLDPLLKRKVHVTALSYNTEIVGDYVISDTRFENEAEAVRFYGGKVLEITRPNYVSDGHASEMPLPDKLVDMRILNSGSLDNLYWTAKEALDAIR